MKPSSLIITTLNMYRAHFCIGLITAVIAASLFIIDCAILALHVIQSRTALTTSLIVIELTAALTLFMTVIGTGLLTNTFI